MVKKGQLKAVFDEDLERYLQSLGCLEEFKDGRIKCRFCGAVINYDNLNSLFPIDGKIAFCCNEPLCMDQLSNAGRVCD